MSLTKTDYVAHPGEILEELIGSKLKDVARFSIKAGVSRFVLKMLIVGYVDIDKTLAKILGEHTPLSASFWLNLQKNYDRDVAK